MNLKNYIGKGQLLAMNQASRGEEGEYFKTMIAKLKTTLETMPKIYETDGQGDEAIAVLHYFSAGSDWWIVEQDMHEEQLQAFGLACLNGDWLNAEMGFINIQELIAYGVELDLYFRTKPIAEIRK